MRRSAPVSLDRLGADTRQFARDAADRAGMPIEEWLAAAMGEADARPARSETPRRRPGRAEAPVPRAGRTEERAARPRRVPVAPPPEDEGAIDEALDSLTRWMERAESRMAVAARATQEHQDRATGAVSEAIGLIANRLDDLDRKIADGRQVSTEAALKAVEAMEGRLRTAAETGTTPEARMDEMLKAFESRLAGFTERLAVAPRPIGRRGRPPEAELTGAVAEIRERQRELDVAPAPVVAPAAPAIPSSAAIAVMAAEPQRPSPMEADLEALRAEIARLAGTLQAVQSGIAAREPFPAAALHTEITRLRESVAGLATSGEVSTLERAVRTLAVDVGRAREPADLAAIAGPVDLLRLQVGRLSDDVATNVHGRLASDVDRLATKIDQVARSVGDVGDESAAREQATLGGFLGELGAIRARLGELAAPDRIHDLVSAVQELDRRISTMRDGPTEDSTAFAALQPLLEEIRAGLKAPAAALDAQLDRRFEMLGTKLDALRERPSPTVLNAASSAILDRLDALDAKVERAVAREAPSEESMTTMLAALVQRVDQVERSDSVAGGLDALERQILTLADRIDVRTADPAIASLEQSLGDLVGQVAALRQTAPVADLSPEPAPAIDALKTDLAGLKADHEAANERIQTTIEGVHTALEQLVGRLASIETTRAAEPARAAEPSRASAPVSAPVRAAEPVAVEPRPAARPAAAARPATGPLDDVLLEPGASRPGPAASPRTEAESGDVKANFIAAARRAAQSAAAEAAAARSEKPLDLGARLAGVTRGRTGTVPAETSPAEAASKTSLLKTSLVARMRQTLDRRRRPLLLGLAAVVLALGALQAVGSFVGGGTKVAAPAVVADPRTTQSIAPAGPRVGDRAAEVKSGESRSGDTKSNDAKSGDAKSSDAKSSDAKPLAALGAPSRTAGLDKAAAPPADRFVAPAAEPSPGPRVAGLAALSGDLAALPPGFAALRQAALEGDAAAAYDVAARAADGRGMPRDAKLAARILEKLAAAGLAPAQYRLGNQYEKGLGLPRDLASAKSWYQRAAEAGNTRAMHNLAVLLAESGAEPGKPDYAAASVWFRKAAEHGVRDSQFNLAVLLARGLGGPQDLANSYLWFSAAAGQGDDDAAKKRDDVGAKMPAKDLEAARLAAGRWRAKVAEPAANEMPAPAAGAPETAKSAATALMGAPMPIVPPARRDGRV